MTARESSIEADGEYITHPLITAEMLEAREYQIGLVRNSRDRHTLVTLPTGLGKTTVSLLLTAERLHQFGGKSLLLAPTKPLVEQHADFYREALDIADDQVSVFTGEVSPDDRADLWNSSTVVIATPQVVENDLVSNRIDLSSVVHCTFDECHRATGDYSYGYIADRYHSDAENPLVTAMSASPGEDRDGIIEVCQNLGVRNIEVRTEDDDDVADYTYSTEVNWREISLPQDILEVRDAIYELIKERMTRLKEMGVSNTASKDVTQSQLNKMRGECQKLMSNDDSAGYKGMSVVTEVSKLNGAADALESQGVGAFVSYLERNVIEDAKSSDGSKASQRLASDPSFKQAVRKAREIDGRHPKLVQARDEVIRAIGASDDPRVLVFTESRDTAETLTEYLGEHLDVHRFVGQQNKEHSSGMTQKEQKEVLDQFKRGEFDVLVSTSVAEEGLDVPEVDLVLFYEPVPQSIRTIQRRGRTGRQREGAVVVLKAVDNRDGKGSTTVDETYYWVANRREKKMKKETEELKEMSDDIVTDLLDEAQQSGLDDFGDETGSESVSDAAVEFSPDEDEGQQASDEESESEDVTPVDPATDDDEIHIVADQREMDSKVPRKLSTADGVRTSVETLDIGDFILSDRVAVERKSVDDFLGSITNSDRNVFQQVKEITEHYERPVVIIEGESLYGERNIHPNAIRAAVSSIAVDFGASVLRTESVEDTARMLETIATREQEVSDKELSIHGSKETGTVTDQQEYVVSSMANVGPVTARSLLEEFDTVREVMTASHDELCAVDGVGDVTAEQITELLTAEYGGEDS